MKRKLDKTDILWIKAVKYNEVYEYYEKNYNIQKDYKPTIGVLGTIVKQILFDANAMSRAFWLLQIDFMLYQFEYQKNEFTLNEMFWLAFRTWASDLTVDELSELTDGDWRTWWAEDEKKTPVQKLNSLGEAIVNMNEDEIDAALDDLDMPYLK